MTREEITSGFIYKITRKAVDYSQKYAKDDEVQNIVIDTFEDAAKFGYNLAIDQACEWLRVELDKEEERHYIHLHGFDNKRREVFLEDFRKAMKGE